MSVEHMDEIGTLVYQNEMLQIKVDELEDELRSCGGYDIQALRGERDALKQELELVKLELKEKTEQLDSLSQMSSSVHTLMQTLKDENKSSINEKNVQIEALQHQLADCEALVQAQRIKETAAEEERRAKDKALIDLRHEYDILLEGHQELQCRYERNKGAIDVLQGHLDRLQNDHDALLEEKVSLNQTMKAMPSESVVAKRVQKQGEAEVAHRVAEAAAKAAEKNANAQQLWHAEKAELLGRIAELQHQSQQQQPQQKQEQPVVLPSHPSAALSRSAMPADPTSRAAPNSSAQIISQHRNTLESFQNRMNHLLDSEWDIPIEIQELIQQILDSHENAIEDFQNQMLIKDLQNEDLEKAFHLRVKQMEREKHMEAEERLLSQRRAAVAAAARVASTPRSHTDPVRPSGSGTATVAPTPNNEGSRMVNCSRCTFQQLVLSGVCSMCGAELIVPRE